MNVTQSLYNSSHQVANGSEGSDDHHGCFDRATFKPIIISFMSIFVVPTIFGNILIIICYVRFKYFHTISMYKYVVNMAISDLFVGITMFLYPLGAIFDEFRFYKYFCITRTVLVLTAVNSSVLFLTWISIDRFLAIVFPLRHRVESQNKRKLWIIIIITWVVSITGSCSLYLHNGLDEFSNYDLELPCKSSAVIPNSFSLKTDIILAIILCVDLILYIFVLRTILKSTAVKQSGESAFKKTKLMFIVYVTFLICWTPLIISNVINSHIEDISTASKLSCVRESLLMLGVARSCINWVFYGILNKQFRQGFRSILYCCKKDIINFGLRSTPS